MALKQLNLQAITSVKEPSSETSSKPTESGSQMLSVTQRETALARLVDSESSQVVTNKMEAYVGSLIPLEHRLTRDYDIKGYDISSSATIENLERALRTVEATLVPLPFKELQQRLTALFIMLAIPKNFDEDLLILKRDTLAHKLEKWPADVVIEAIDHVEQYQKFMPTLAEFVEYMDWRVKPRKLLRKELKKVLDEKQRKV